MRSSSSRAAKERVIAWLLGLSTLAIVLPVLGILFFLVRFGLKAISWEFLTSMPRSGMTEGGIMPAIVGTFYLVMGTIIIAMPLGVLAAIYLSEYAGAGPFVRLIRLSITNLAGVPSVVYGLFGLGLFVLMLNFSTSILAGSFTLALLVLPLVITAAEESLRRVPNSLREASLALGTTKWQTVRNVVLPNSWAGILTGIILSIGRAAGETAPILFTAVVYYQFYVPQPAGLPYERRFWDFLFEPVMALPYHLYTLSTQATDVDPALQWGTALVLLALVLGMSAIAILLRARLGAGTRW
ncbi:MAG: phosphate ABC transporter permease PstA [Armatimonadetes bacterium]|nr:phosphate ABC transporter permease PstA [Armatimonadota bacterium]